MDPVVCPPIKRRTLAMLLQQLEPLPNPQATLEQYATPPEIAAELLYRAYGHRDIYGRVVADLGCGNGQLALGAARVGAARVVALDADPQAVAVAQRNAEALDLSVDFQVGDVVEFQEAVDTVLMNPPFGGQRRHADRPFLEVGLRQGQVAYSFHNAVTREFVEATVAELGGTATLLRTYKFPLPFTHPFHRKAVGAVEVDLFRMVRTSR